MFRTIIIALVLNLVVFKVQVHSQSFNSTNRNQLTSRLPIKNTRSNVSIIAGGWDGHGPMRSVEIFDMDKQVFTTGSDMLMNRSDAGYAVFQGKFYLVGGRITAFKYKDTASVEYYDADTDEWTFGTSMQISRSRLGVAVVNNQLYALGGFDGETILNTVEVYDPYQDGWSYLSTLMPFKTEMFGITALYNQIYVIGGRGLDGKLNRVQIYDTKADKWSFAPDLLTSRVGAGIGVCNDHIYVMGGLVDMQLNAYEKTVECYDVKTKKWSFIISLYNTRAFLSVVEYMDQLYAIGGKNNSVQDISLIEIFIPYTKTIFTLPKNLHQGRAGLAAAYIYKPYNL